MALWPLIFLYDDVVRIECLYISSASRHFCCHFHANWHTCCLRLLLFCCSYCGDPLFRRLRREKRECGDTPPPARAAAPALCYKVYGLSARADAMSRRRLGDIVDERTTLLTYEPFAPVGLARTTASTTDVRFAINASSLNESLPAGICSRAVLSTLNSTRPAFTSWMVFAKSNVMVR